MSNFILTDHKTDYLLPPSVDDWLIKAHQKQLEHIAHFDALTNLPNRVLLADHLQQALASVHKKSKDPRYKALAFTNVCAVPGVCLIHPSLFKS